MRNLHNRLSRLEVRALMIGPVGSFSARIQFVDPVDGLTSVLLIESDKPAIEVPSTEEERESIRAYLKSRECARANYESRL
jgi:hypothetical protein